MRTATGIAAWGVALCMGAATLTAPHAARASEQGRRNTAIGLGAAAAYLLATQKNKTAGLVVGAGALYAAKRMQDSIDARHERERRGYYGSYYRDANARRYSQSRHRSAREARYSKHNKRYAKSNRGYGRGGRNAYHASQYDGRSCR